MKPLFTIHEGEFLVGDYILRHFGDKYDVWVPAKDTGVDLLVTRKDRSRRSAALQVKFSRSFEIPEKIADHVVATSWFQPDPRKVRDSTADLWVFVILTLRHEAHFVVIPTAELRERLPGAPGSRWSLYLWVYGDRTTCYDVRGLRAAEQRDTIEGGVRDPKRDYSKWLGAWDLLDRTTKGSR